MDRQVAVPNQLDVFDSGARARTSDPDTSKAAAASVQNLRASHRRVLAMFRAYGDMTDETLAEYLNEAARDTGVKMMSPSGVRSRRSELSKPNMDRIEELMMEWTRTHRPHINVHPLTYRSHLDNHEVAAACVWARATLITEGIRSPLWDTGRREKLSSGRMAIVWGLAR